MLRGRKGGPVVLSVLASQGNRAMTIHFEDNEFQIQDMSVTTTLPQIEQVIACCETSHNVDGTTDPC